MFSRKRAPIVRPLGGEPSTSPCRKLRENSASCEGMDASGPFDGYLNAALTEAFGQSVSGLSATLGDSSTDAIDAVASTRGSEMSFGRGVDPSEHVDRETMDTIGHEVAHALAGGGSGKTLLDTPGDPGERRAERAGADFGRWMASGAKGPAPRLSAAIGGRAMIHRKKKPGASSGESGTETKETDVDWLPISVRDHKATAFTEHTTSSFNPENTASVAVAEPNQGMQDRRVVSARRTDLYEEKQSGGLGPVSGERGSARAEVVEAFVSSTADNGLQPGLKIGWQGPSGAHPPGTGGGGNRTIASAALRHQLNAPVGYGDNDGWGYHSNGLYPGEGMRFAKRDGHTSGGQLFAGYSDTRGTNREMSVYRPGFDQLTFALSEGKSASQRPGGSLAVVGAGYSVHTDSRQTDRFQLDQKSATPATMDALMEFWDTGLMPGSRRLPELGSPEQQQAHSALLQQFDAANATERALNDQLAESRWNKLEREALLQRRNEARERATALRGQVRTAWNRHVDVQGRDVMPGLRHDMSLASGEQTSGWDASVGIKKTPLQLSRQFGRQESGFVSGWHEKEGMKTFNYTNQPMDTRGREAINTSYSTSREDESGVNVISAVPRASRKSRR